ncbi:MAG: hypothetical protein Q3982_02905, partial [Phoenicibacter congonensis]|nr:hypothetical protein [Phoenicibacter congonensis]
EENNEKTGWTPAEDSQETANEAAVENVAEETATPEADETASVVSETPEKAGDAAVSSEGSTAAADSSAEVAAETSEDDSEVASEAASEESNFEVAPAASSETAQEQAEGEQVAYAVDTPEVAPYIPDVEPENVTYEKGCLSAAWADIKGSKGWFRKILLMALIEFIPILNWVNKGYALRWSRELSIGSLGAMPKKIFGDRVFVTGAMSWLVRFVVNIVVIFVAVFLVLVPVVGSLVAIAFGIFVDMIFNILYVRMAIFDELGEGFQVGAGFRAMKKEPGKAFLISFMPELVIVIAGIVVFLIISTLCVSVTGAIAINALQPYVDQAGGTIQQFEYMLSNNTAFAQKVAMIVVGLLVSLIPWILVGYYLCAVVFVFCQLWQVRAAGHYAVRYCSEWRDEPKFLYCINRR